MKAFDSNPKLRWMFCMTHPDDEISICAWIRRLARQGNEVYVSWTHSTPIREAEARAVATLLDIPLENLHFFRATDGRVAEEMPELLPRFKEWIRSVNPDRVCCGAFEQGHIDHDATNLLVSASFNGPIYEIPFYHTYLTRFQRLNRFADPAGEETLGLDIHEQRLKTHVARQYPSQNIWTILLWYELYQRARFKPMDLIKTERMRLKTHTDYLRPNLPPKLTAKVRRCATWKRWEQAVLNVTPQLVEMPANEALITH